MWITTGRKCYLCKWQTLTGRCFHTKAGYYAKRVNPYNALTCSYYETENGDEELKKDTYNGEY